MRTLPNVPGATGAPERALTLALNAAENRLQLCAANQAGDMVFAQSWHAPSRGAEVLAPALEAALRLSGHTPRDIARIACVRGPGSFTGLRLALITASGLARASGALTAGIDYLPLLALNVFAAPGGFAREKRVWIVTHARRNLVHAQAFALDLPASRAACPDGPGGPGAPGGPDAPGAPGAPGAPDGASSGPAQDMAQGPAQDMAQDMAQGMAQGAPVEEKITAIRPLTGLLVLRIHDDAPENRLAAHIAALGSPAEGVLLAGSGVTRNRDDLERALAESGVCWRMAGPACDHPSLETLCRASLEAEYGTEDVRAVYARPCDAEENLPRIAEKLGLNPEDARKKLDELTHGERFFA